MPFFILFLLLSFIQLGDSGSKTGKYHRRAIRSIKDLARMVRSTTGRNALAFNDYGNYCGFGGDGPPLDGIDNCCAIHDRCYDNLNQHGCVPYFTPYNYLIDGNFIACEFTGDWCQDITCLCDRDLAQCIPWHPYNRRLKHFPYVGTVIKKFMEYKFKWWKKRFRN